jgi:hypothetical protein
MLVALLFCDTKLTIIREFLFAPPTFSHSPSEFLKISLSHDNYGALKGTQNLKKKYNSLFKV